MDRQEHTGSGWAEHLQWLAENCEDEPPGLTLEDANEWARLRSIYIAKRARAIQDGRPA